jgi:hypothetical protein
LQGVSGVVAGHQEVTLPGHEVCGGTREGGGQDPARPELAQLVRTRIAVDAVEGSMEVVGQGSVAVMMWSPAWISMVW